MSAANTIDGSPPTAASMTEGEPYHHDGENMPRHTHHDEEVMSEEKVRQYWKANVRLLLGLLAIWFVVSFGAGILFVEPLNNLSLGGYPLGFWFAQQGSIYTFVGLIFFYTYKMKKLSATLASMMTNKEH